MGEESITVYGSSQTGLRVGDLEGMDLIRAWSLGSKRGGSSLGPQGLLFALQTNFRGVSGIWKDVSHIGPFLWLLGLWLSHFSENAFCRTFQRGLILKYWENFLFLSWLVIISQAKVCGFLVIISFMILLAFSTLPEDCGLQAQCKLYLIPRAWDTPWVSANLKARPLSFCNPWSSSNQGMISCKSIFTTSLACSVLQGKASIYLVNVFTHTAKYWNSFTFGICLKFIYQSAPVYLPVRCNPGGAVLLLNRLFFWQIF